MKKKRIQTIILATCLLLTSGCMSKGKIISTANEIVNNYNEESLDYDQASMQLNDLLSEIDDSDSEVYIQNLQELMDKLKQSKTDFSAAEQAYSKADYKDAISKYAKVISGDSNYDESVSKLAESKKKFIEIADQKAKIYLDDNKYLEAVSVYETAQKTYDDNTLDSKIADVKQKYRIYLEDKAKKFEKDKDWASVIQTYNKLKDYFQDNSYEVEITNAQNTCVNSAIKKSEKALKKGNYNDAKSALSIAEGVVPDSKELKEQRERVNSFCPVALTDIDPFYEKTDSSYLEIDKWTAQDTDNLGNGGNSGIKIINEGARNEWVTISYMLNGEYDTLTGTFSLSYDSRDCTDEDDFGAQLVIYNDEDEMIFLTAQLLGGVEPIDVNVNISGVKELKVCFYSGNSSWFGSSTFIFGFVNPMLHKNYVAPKK